MLARWLQCHCLINKLLRCLKRLELASCVHHSMHVRKQLALTWRHERLRRAQQHAPWHALVTRQLSALGLYSDRDADVIVVGGGHAGAPFYSDSASAFAQRRKLLLILLPQHHSPSKDTKIKDLD